MKYSEWNVRDLGDNSCIFSISNYNEDQLFDYLYTIQQYILQLGMGDYSVISYAIIEYYNSIEVDLDIITDFPYSFFSIFNPDCDGAIEIIFKKSKFHLHYYNAFLQRRIAMEYKKESL